MASVKVVPDSQSIYAARYLAAAAALQMRRGLGSTVTEPRRD
jgi:hypothetical protein